MDSKKFLMMLLVVVFIFVGINYALCFVHEMIHVQVYKEYGVSSYFNLTWYGKGETFVSNMTEYDQLATERKESVRDMHLFAEIIGYNLIILVMVITGLMLLWMMISVMQHS